MGDFDARSTEEEQPEKPETEKPGDEKPDRSAEEQRPEQPKSDENAQDEQPKEQRDAVTTGTNHEKASEDAKPESLPIPSEDVPTTSNQDVHRGAEDDGGEVVEDNEDTVIY